MTPTDKEVQSEKNRRAKTPRNLRRIVRQLQSKLHAVEIENIGYGYAIQTLRHNMGLDNSSTDLRECLLKYESMKSESNCESRLQMAVNASCSCGGKGPMDGCCQACEVWHRFHRRIMKP